MYVVKYQDSFGRIKYAPVEDFVEFYANRIAHGEMSEKDLKDCVIFTAAKIDVAPSLPEIKKLVQRIRLLIRVKTAGPGMLAELVNKREITVEDALKIKQEIVQRWPLDSDNFDSDLSDIVAQRTQGLAQIREAGPAVLDNLVTQGKISNERALSIRQEIVQRWPLDSRGFETIQIVAPPTMMPGETSYTPKELERLYQMVEEAAVGDPGEGNEP